jgi:hypothetical protein
VLGESCEDESNFSMQTFLETNVTMCLGNWEGVLVMNNSFIMSTYGAGYHCTSMHPPPSLSPSAHAILIRLEELVGFHISIFVAFRFSLFAFRFSLFTFHFSLFAFHF